MTTVTMTAYLLDEDPNAVRSTEATLRQHGIRPVGRAHGAKKALWEIPKLKSDLVFLDLVMPGMTGLDCVRRLSAIHRNECLATISYAST